MTAGTQFPSVRQLWPSGTAQFRHALGHSASGVVVVTCASATGLCGMTCQSFASASLNPPVVMFMPARTSTTYPLPRAVRNIAVSVLHRSQAELARRFAARSTDRWQGVDWHIGGAGAHTSTGQWGGWIAPLRPSTKPATT